jgi:hypothetical protein
MLWASEHMQWARVSLEVMQTAPLGASVSCSYRRGQGAVDGEGTPAHAHTWGDGFLMDMYIHVSVLVNQTSVY